MYICAMKQRKRDGVTMVSVQGWIPTVTRDQVEELSLQDGITVSHWIRRAIKEKLTRDLGSSNDNNKR